VGDANIGAPALVVANISCRISTNPAATAAGNAAGKSQDDYLVCLHPSKVLALPRIETQLQSATSLERAATEKTGITAPYVFTYAWHNFPPCTLYNSDGLPAGPMVAAVPWAL
jgi:hypothetical protein